MSRLLIPVLLLLSTSALAEEVDPQTLYSLETGKSSGELKKGETGRFVLELVPSEGAYISASTPFRLVLEGDKVKPASSTLRIQDAQQGPASTPPQPVARFEVPLVAEAVGEGSVRAKVTFFICTSTLCLRQERELTVQVKVR